QRLGLWRGGGFGLGWRLGLRRHFQVTSETGAGWASAGPAPLRRCPMAVKSTCPPTILWLAILLTSSTMQYANSTESESAGVRCEIRTVRDDHGGKVEGKNQAK